MMAGRVIDGLLIQFLQSDPEGLESACGDDPGYLCEHVYDWTENETLAKAANWLGDVPVSIFFIVVTAVIVNRILRRAIKRLADRIAHDARPEAKKGWIHKAPVLIAAPGDDARAAARARTVGVVLRSLSSVVIYSIATLMVLGQLNIDLAPLFYSAGIAGVALGFGAQSLVRDFLSGTLMLIEDVYGVGDVVDLGEAVGTVEKITLRTTRLRDVNGRVWFVPNGEIRRVANMSMQWGRAVLDIPVTYGTDLARAKSVMTKVANDLAEEEAWSDKLLEAPEFWGVESVGVESVSIRLVVKTQPTAVPSVQRELRQRIVAKFEEEGIQMPRFPTFPSPGAAG